MVERRVVSPYALAGGAEPRPYRVVLNPGGPGAREVRGKETFRLRAGDLVLIESCGGGGHGPAAERPPDLRERDCREGYVE